MYTTKALYFINLNQLPLNSGAIRKMVKHPTLENCPKHVSIKNNGIPHNNSIERYGTKKAPSISLQK